MNEITFLFNANIYFYPFLRLFEVEFCPLFSVVVFVCSNSSFIPLFFIIPPLGGERTLSLSLSQTSLP